MVSNSITVVIQDSWNPNFGTDSVSRTIDEDGPEISINLNVWYSASYPNIADLEFGNVEFVTDNGSVFSTRVEDAGTQNPEFWIDYTVAADYSGKERISYEIYDPIADVTRSAYVYITIIPDNDAPFFTSVLEDNWQINEDGTFITIVTFDDVDNDNADLVFNAYIDSHSNSNRPAMITEDIVVVRNDDSTVSITIDAIPERSGTFDLVYEISDGIETTSVRTNGEVLEVDDPPTANAITDEIYEDTITTIDLLDYVYDIDTPSSSMTFSITQPNHGTAVLNGIEVTFTPERNNYSTANFTYTLHSGSYNLTRDITIDIISVNDYPYVYDIVGYVASDEDEEVRIDFSSYDVEDDYNVTFSFVSSDGTLVDVSGIVVEGTGEHRTIVFTPEAICTVLAH